MQIVAAVGSPDFSYGAALVALLTVETLAFAALAVAVSFSVPTNHIPNLPVSLPRFGDLAASFVSIVAFGACVSWAGLFGKHWPGSLSNCLISVVLGISIVGQPVFAWMTARGLRPQ